VQQEVIIAEQMAPKRPAPKRRCWNVTYPFQQWRCTRQVA